MSIINKGANLSELTKRKPRPPNSKTYRNGYKATTHLMCGKCQAKTTLVREASHTLEIGTCSFCGTVGAACKRVKNQPLHTVYGTRT